MTADFESRKFMAISKIAMEEVLKALNIVVKVLARRSSAMWGIVLITKRQRKC